MSTSLAPVVKFSFRTSAQQTTNLEKHRLPGETDSALIGRMLHYLSRTIAANSEPVTMLLSSAEARTRIYSCELSPGNTKFVEDWRNKLPEKYTQAVLERLIMWATSLPVVPPLERVDDLLKVVESMRLPHTEMVKAPELMRALRQGVFVDKGDRQKLMACAQANLITLISQAIGCGQGDNPIGSLVTHSDRESQKIKIGEHLRHVSHLERRFALPYLNYQDARDILQMSLEGYPGKPCRADLVRSLERILNSKAPIALLYNNKVAGYLINSQQLTVPLPELVSRLSAVSSTQPEFRKDLGIVLTQLRNGDCEAATIRIRSNKEDYLVIAGCEYARAAKLLPID